MVPKLFGLYGKDMMAKLASSHHYTALDHAILGGYLEIVRVLAPIRIPVSNPLRTHEQYLSAAFVLSAAAGNTEICKYLISEGADVDFLPISGRPALRFAINNLAMVQLLLASGADPNICDDFGRPPIFFTTDIDVACALRAAGANIHAEDRKSFNVLWYSRNIGLFRFFLECGVDPNHEDDIGCTPLHICIRERAADFSKLLVQFGAVTVEKADAWGKTPVDLAIARGRDFLEVVEMLEPLVQNPDLRAKIAAFRGT
ncbi:ankyrin repeat-containing domain protein [Mycena galopus ATCC 62051]|nr:ankyrin repeat-containing domain protein [Mycena galopus ATCC 62051]